MSPALVAAAMSTLVSLSTTSIASLASSLKPLSMEVKYSVAWPESIIPNLLKCKEALIKSLVSAIE